jgi:hypothetical protein
MASMMWRRLLWLGLLVGSLVVARELYSRALLWRTDVERERARQEIARGLTEPARQRLESLSTRRPGALGGVVDYLLGICEASAGHQEAALQAFSRVPESFAFEPRGAYLEAKANLAHGRLRPAERRLEAALARGGLGLGQVFSLLGHIYEMQARFDDAKTLLRAA